MNVKATQPTTRIPSRSARGAAILCSRKSRSGKLRPPPDVLYDVAEWVYNRSVNLNFNVEYARNLYFVPYRYAWRKVNLRVSESTASIYHAE